MKCKCGKSKTRYEVKIKTVTKNTGFAGLVMMRGNKMKKKKKKTIVRLKPKSSLLPFITMTLTVALVISSCHSLSLPDKDGEIQRIAESDVIVFNNYSETLRQAKQKIEKQTKKISSLEKENSRLVNAIDQQQCRIEELTDGQKHLCDTKPSE